MTLGLGGRPLLEVTPARLTTFEGAVTRHLTAQAPGRLSAVPLEVALFKAIEAAAVPCRRMVLAGMNLGQLAPAPAPTAYHAPAPVLRCGVRRPLGVSAQTDAAVAWQQAAATGAPWAGTSELPHLDRMGGSGVVSLSVLPPNLILFTCVQSLYSMLNFALYILRYPQF